VIVCVGVIVGVIEGVGVIVGVIEDVGVIVGVIDGVGVIVGVIEGVGGTSTPNTTGTPPKSTILPSCVIIILIV
jgi:hypothetical protein